MDAFPLTFARPLAGDDDGPLDAFAQGAGSGASGLEVDLEAGPEGRVAATQIPARPRRTRLGRPAAPAGVAPPTLGDVLTTVPEHVALSVGVADSAAARIALDAVRGRLGPLWLRAGNLDLLAEIGAGLPARRVHETEPDRVRVPMERHAHLLHEAGVDAIRLPHDAWSAGLVALFHRFGVRAFAADATEVRHIRAVLAMGIDGVVSVRTDRLVAAVGEWRISAR